MSTTPRPLYSRERNGTHCTAGWVGPRAGLDGWRKISPPPGFDPRTVQPVASRCTNYAIPAHTVLSLRNKICVNFERPWMRDVIGNGRIRCLFFPNSTGAIVVLDERVMILSGGDVRLEALSRHSEVRIKESHENTHRTPGNRPDIRNRCSKLKV